MQSAQQVQHRANPLLGVPPTQDRRTPEVDPLSDARGTGHEIATKDSAPGRYGRSVESDQPGFTGGAGRKRGDVDRRASSGDRVTKLRGNCIIECPLRPRVNVHRVTPQRRGDLVQIHRRHHRQPEPRRQPGLQQREHTVPNLARRTHSAQSQRRLVPRPISAARPASSHGRGLDHLVEMTAVPIPRLPGAAAPRALAINQSAAQTIRTEHRRRATRDRARSAWPRSQHRALDERVAGLVRLSFESACDGRAARDQERRQRPLTDAVNVVWMRVCGDSESHPPEQRDDLGRSVGAATASLARQAVGRR